MTKQDKFTILSLHDKGLTYIQIGRELNMSPNTVKSIYRRETEKKKQCRNCRQPLIQGGGGRPRSFCCDNCRILWWKKHPEKVNRRAYYQLTCAGCGQQFDSYGRKRRKYCNHQCYVVDRFGVPSFPQPEQPLLKKDLTI